MATWLRLSQAAELAGVSRVTLHRAAARAEIPFAPTAVGRLFNVDDVNAWAANRRTAAKLAPVSA